MSPFLFLFSILSLFSCPCGWFMCLPTSPLATAQALVQALFWAPTPQIVTSNHCPTSPFFPSALTGGDQSFTSSFCKFSRCSLIALSLAPSLSLLPPFTRRTI